MKCPLCGRRIESDAKKCIWCGYPIEKGVKFSFNLFGQRYKIIRIFLSYIARRPPLQIAKQLSGGWIVFIRADA